MFRPIKTLDLELTASPADVEGLGGYESVRCLVRLHGAPVGSVTVPIRGGRCRASDLVQAALAACGDAAVRRVGESALGRPAATTSIDRLVAAPAPGGGALPSMTVAVCTRDRTDDLAGCLAALEVLDLPDVDLLVIDNAPATDATRRLVAERHPRVRYVCEERPGLDWARNRAIREARGDVIAFTDDDAIVDPGWARALATLFGASPEVMGATGLVVPYELETEAQALFEEYGGFGRGCERRWFGVRPGGAIARWYAGSGFLGTGANMAFRRALFAEVGEFDPALDVGTVTNGGGDLEMFFRVLKAGHVFVYEPRAIVRHRHRRSLPELETQLRNHGIALFAHFVRTATAFPEERFGTLRLGLWWFWWWYVRRLVLVLMNPQFFPRRLIWSELWGSVVGLGRWRPAHRRAVELGADPTPPRPHVRSVDGRRRWVAVRSVDVGQELTPLDDVADVDSVTVFATWHDHLLGSVTIHNQGHPVSAPRLRDALAAVAPRLLELAAGADEGDVTSAIERRSLPAGAGPAGLDPAVTVSVVLATYDRPDELRQALRSLTQQETSRPLEIVVVDNHPASGQTAPVVAEFPGVLLVEEPRQGLAYARNAGFTASRGEIVVTTDDDVRMPVDWIEKLVAPFAEAHVMAVTGNVLPLELDTDAQCLFESYGGLGRGFEPVKVDGHWFRSFHFGSVPTWTLGATANAAFRATIFADPEVGLMDEALGPGTPTGVGEDTYLFYKVLRAGGTIVYAPDAWVWHRHRREMDALRRQLVAYSTGHVAYHLTTLLRDGDLRALVRIAIGLPMAHGWRAVRRVVRRMPPTLLMLAWEVAGNLAGPWRLFQSRRRVRRLGRSAPYVAPAARAALAPARLAASARE